MHADATAVTIHRLRRFGFISLSLELFIPPKYSRWLRQYCQKRDRARAQADNRAAVDTFHYAATPALLPPRAS